MGFLDNKGVKKLVNWINNKINNISVPETGQPKWDFQNTNGSNVNLISYHIINFDGYGTLISIKFDYNPLPDENKEYKLRATGSRLNYISWPSKFDMHWPNNEIPIFEKNKRYEIYIAGGRVVSIDDISGLEEEVIYVFNTSSECEINISLYDCPFTYYVNNEEYIATSPHNYIYLSSGENIVKIKGCFDDFTIYPIMSDHTVTLDCSKMKSNNFNKVASRLNIDNIIYPEECYGYVLDPNYNFTTDTFLVSFLKNNILIRPKFIFKVNHLTVNGPINVSESISFSNTELTNIQVNEILRNVIEVDNVIFNHDYFDFKHKYYTIGVVYGDPCKIGASLSNYPIAMNCMIIGHTLFDYKLSEECYINCNNFPFKFSSYETFNNKILFLYNVDWENSIFEAHNGHLDIYYNEEIPQHIIDNAINCTFIKVNNAEEIPFKYLPLNLEDVKNYDENGNIID